jgi:hypothetical protein
MCVCVCVCVSCVLSVLSVLNVLSVLSVLSVLCVLCVCVCVSRDIEHDDFIGDKLGEYGIFCGKMSWKATIHDTGT